MENIDYSAFVNPLLSALGLALAGVLIALANKAINALQQRNIIQVTDQQRAQVDGVIQDAAGRLVAQLARGVITIDQIHTKSDAVARVAQTATDSAAPAVVALGVTRETVEAAVVGAVGRAIALDPTIPTVPVTTRGTSTSTGTQGEQTTQVEQTTKTN